jgi:hypothetical protein
MNSTKRFADTKYDYFHWFEISGIIFCDTDCVTLAGWTHIQGKQTFINLFTDFSSLAWILKEENKYGGDEITIAIAEKLSGYSDSFTELRIKDILNKNFYIADYYFIVSYDNFTEEPDKEEEFYDLEYNEKLVLPSLYYLEEFHQTIPCNILDKSLFPPNIYVELDYLFGVYQMFEYLITKGHKEELVRRMLHLENNNLFEILKKLNE